MTMLLRRDLLLTALLALASGRASAADPWQELARGRAFVIMRHALAPGTGDPPNMRLGDCSTQRNLSADGRTQASRTGQLFRDKGIRRASVHSSEWCRCLDTAELLGLGPVTPQPLLNSFFGTPENGRAQTDGLRRWLATMSSELPLVLVTHQVNVTGLTSVVPRSGELVFISFDPAGGITVIGRQSAGA